MIQAPDSSAGFKIGTAAKMAGISPNTIRTWMRREYFTPSMETSSGERILSSDDVKRLVQLKSLIELGDSIGRIARLDDDALGARLEELRSSSEAGFSNPIPSLADLRAALVSSRESPRLGNTAHFFWNTRSYQNALELKSASEEGETFSIVLFDFQSRNPREKQDILEFAQTNPATPVVVVFDFMPRSTLQELSKARVHLLRWPINSIMMERYLYSVLPLVGNAPREPEETEIPARLFTERQLAALAEIQPELDCECPRHLSSLVASLSAFEDYSSQCIVSSPKDHILHQHLHRETAKARHTMERALIRLCHDDGVQIPQI